MTKTIFLFFLFILFVTLATGCDVLQAIAPLPQPTIQPIATETINTPTPLPTLGALEYLHAGYCLESLGEEDEYNLLSFFPSGVVLEVTVKGYSSCSEAWDKTAPYLLETATDRLNHGEYQFSGSQIRFSLAPAKSNQAAGYVVGRYEQEKLILQRQGVEMEYVLVDGGKLP